MDSIPPLPPLPILVSSEESLPVTGIFRNGHDEVFICDNFNEPFPEWKVYVRKRNGMAAKIYKTIVKALRLIAYGILGLISYYVYEYLWIR